jgi:hypothetical protein
MSSAACLREETEEIERSTDRVAEVSISHRSRWSNEHPGRAGKPGHRAKGLTVKSWVEGRLEATKTFEIWQDQTRCGSKH